MTMHLLIMQVFTTVSMDIKTQYIQKVKISEKKSGSPSSAANFSRIVSNDRSHSMDENNIHQQSFAYP